MEILESIKKNKAVWVLAGIIILIFVFGAGMFAGYRRALFSTRWGENYYRNFYDDRRGTAVLRGGETLELSDLKIGDAVTVIGAPNDKGQIEAKLIRVFDSSSTMWRDMMPRR